MDSDEVYDGPWQFDPRYDQYPGYDYTKDPRVEIVPAEKTDTRDKSQETNNNKDDGMQRSNSSGRSGSGN